MLRDGEADGFFSKNTASLIKNLGKGETADYSGCRECSICLGSVLVSIIHWKMIFVKRLTTDLICSDLTSACSWQLVPMYGITSASAVSSILLSTRCSNVPIVVHTQT